MTSIKVFAQKQLTFRGEVETTMLQMFEQTVGSRKFTSTIKLLMAQYLLTADAPTPPRHQSASPTE